MFQYDELIAAGFTGFKTVKQMNNGGLSSVAESQGVYMILYLNPTGEMPNFLPVGTGGLFKGEDPNVSIVELQNNWVEGTPVVYIGKATSIKKRLSQYMRFGQGKNVGHKGGRYIWQIPNSENFVVCWKPTQEDSRTVEAELIQQFVAEFGKRPFANLRD